MCPKHHNKGGCGHTGGLGGGQKLDHKELCKSCQKSILSPKGFEIDGLICILKVKSSMALDDGSK